jgi:PAS domain S-box-containing protein
MDEGIGLTAALTIGAAAYLGVAAYVFRHRRAVGGCALALLLLASGVWTICNAIEVSMADPRDQELWGSIKYAGIVAFSPAFLAFALEYTGRRRKMGARLVGLLSIEPVLVLAALAVPATHDLIRFVPSDAAYGPYTEVVNGPLFPFHAVYSYAMILAAIGLLVARLLRASRQHALRSWSLIVCCLAPLAANAAFNFHLVRVRVDPTPLGFSLAGFVLVWGFFRFRLHELVPVGRRQVVDRIPDAVLVLDLQGRVLDANPAASVLAGDSASALVGRHLVDVLPQLRQLAGRTEPSAHGADSCRVRTPAGTDLDLAVTISPLPDDVRVPTGRLVVLRDVTAQRDVERRLREVVRERSAIIEILRPGCTRPGRR